MLDRDFIRNEFRQNWEQFEREPEDTVLQWVDSFLPVYYSEIVNEWHKEMPNEYVDTWQDLYSGQEVKSIYDLMTGDLWNWYHATYTEIYECLRIELAPEYEGEICECASCNLARILAEADLRRAGN